MIENRDLLARWCARQANADVPLTGLAALARATEGDLS